jgi:hypothetical protein
VLSRRAVIGFVALGLATACARRDRAAGELRIGGAAPVVGEHQTLTDELTSHSEVTAGPGQVVRLATRRSRQFDVEVRAVDAAGVVTAARARFDRHQIEQTKDGVASTKPSPLAGQTYDVRADGDALAATHADGSAVTPAELAALTADLGRAIGRVPPLAVLLRSRAWPRGEPIELGPAELMDAFGHNPMMPPVSGTALLVGVADGVATFEFDLALARDDADGRAESTMRLTTRVDVARGRPLEQRLTGTLGGKVAGMPSTGTVEGTITYGYAAASR